LNSGKLIEELFQTVKRAEQAATQETAEIPNHAADPASSPHSLKSKNRESKHRQTTVQKADEAAWSERG
jgi:hypothetical protein